MCGCVRRAARSNTPALPAYAPCVVTAEPLIRNRTVIAERRDYRRTHLYDPAVLVGAPWCTACAGLVAVAAMAEDVDVSVAVVVVVVTSHTAGNVHPWRGTRPEFVGEARTVCAAAVVATPVVVVEGSTAHADHVGAPVRALNPQLAPRAALGGRFHPLPECAVHGDLGCPHGKGLGHQRQHSAVQLWADPFDVFLRHDGVAARVGAADLCSLTFQMALHPRG